MSRPSYLVPRKDTGRWYYRRRYPVHLVGIIGQPEFNQSTGTSELSEAKKVIGMMEARFRVAIATAEERLAEAGDPVRRAESGDIVSRLPTLSFPSAPSLPRLTDEQATSLALRYFRTRLLELDRSTDSTVFDPKWAQELDDRIAMLRDADDDQTLRWTQEQAAGLLVLHGMAAEPHEGAGLLLTNLLRRALLQLVAIQRARLDGDYSDRITDRAFSPNSAVAGPIEATLAAKPPGTTMLDGKLIELWAAERKVSPKGVDKHKAVVRWFYERVGRVAAEDITVTHVIDFKNSMVRDGVTAANANTKLSCLRTLLQYAKLNHIRHDNPATGINILDKDAPRRKRKEWDVPTLHRLFASPIYASDERPTRGRGEAAYWMPLIALFSGARLEEIAQLRLSDFALETYYGDADAECSAWVMNITHDEADDDDHLGTSTKTPAGTRRVPVHPELIGLGLIRYISDLKRAGEARLFPKLTTNKYEKLGAKWGEWWSIYRREVCGITTDGVVFHSFRHTFKYFARHVSMESSIQREIMGHSPGDTADEYAPSGHGLHRLVEAMRSYRIPGLKLPPPPPSYRN